MCFDHLDSDRSDHFDARHDVKKMQIPESSAESLRRDVQTEIVNQGVPWRPEWDAWFPSIPSLYPELLDPAGARYGQLGVFSAYESKQLHSGIVGVFAEALMSGLDPISDSYDILIYHLPFLGQWTDQGPHEGRREVVPSALYSFLASYYVALESVRDVNAALARLTYYWFHELYLFESGGSWVGFSTQPDLLRKMLLACIAVGRHAYLLDLSPIPFAAIDPSADLETGIALGIAPGLQQPWPNAEELASSSDWRELVATIVKGTPIITTAEFVDYVRRGLLASIYRPGGPFVLEQRARTETEVGLVSPACSRMSREQMLRAVQDLFSHSGVNVFCEVIRKYAAMAGFEVSNIEPCLEQDRSQLIRTAVRIVNVLTREFLCAIVREYGPRIDCRVDGVDAREF